MFPKYLEEYASPDENTEIFDGPEIAFAKELVHACGINSCVLMGILIAKVVMRWYAITVLPKLKMTYTVSLTVFDGNPINMCFAP